MTLSPKKRIAIFVTFIALFVFLIPIIFLNVTGYRFNKENILVPTGGIYIHPWNVSGIITLDDKPVDDNGIFGIGKNYFFQNLSEGKHTVVFTKDNYSEWKKEISVYEKIVTEVSPFIISKNLNIVSIPKMDGKIVNPDFKKINDLFALPVTKVTPLESATLQKTTSDGTLKDGYVLYQKMALWKSSDKLNAEWTGDANLVPSYFCDSELRKKCTTIIPTAVSAKDVTEFNFYPGRNDILLAVLPDGLYAIELDTRDNVNKVKMIDGKKLDFRIGDETTIYVKKSPSTFLVVTLE